MSKTKNEGGGNDVRVRAESEGHSYFHGLSFLTFLPFDILIVSLFDIFTLYIFTFEQSRENHNNKQSICRHYVISMTFFLKKLTGLMCVINNKTLSMTRIVQTQINKYTESESRNHR
jgi:hypothetical protein